MENIFFDKTIKVLAPATIANFVCGFDILGMEIGIISDEIKMRLVEKQGIIIQHNDIYNLPINPTLNVAGVALQALLDAYPNKEIGAEMIITKLVKPGSGLGSSAASASAAVVGANYLLNNYFSKNELISFAMKGEEVASQAKHADNIAPCIYGGVTIIRGAEPVDIFSLPTPNLFLTIVHPQIEIKTADARKILPTEITLKVATKQWGNIASLVAGICNNDIDLIGNSLEDVIIEPIRSKLIPAFNEIKKASMMEGSIGGGICGSGPSIFMLSKDEATAKKIEIAMQNIYNNLSIEYITYVTSITKNGVSVQEI